MYEMLVLLQRIHMMEYCELMEKNGEVCYVLIWKNLQNILIRGKMIWKHVYTRLPFGKE